MSEFNQAYMKNSKPAQKYMGGKIDFKMINIMNYI